MAVRVPQERASSPGPVCAPAFTARDRELTALTQAVAEPAAVVLVEGEAGIGKTRLVRELLAARPADGPTTLVAACPPYRESPTLGPLVDALRRARPPLADLPMSPLGGALRPLLPEWAADLPPEPEPVADATVARHRTLRALLELVRLLDVGLLVVEDAHWADDATLQLLLMIAAGQEATDPSLVVTYRPEELAAGSLLRRLSAQVPDGRRCERLTLGSLDAAGTTALVSSMLDRQPLSDAFASFLQDSTGGVPLAVEQSVRLMVDRADLVRREGEWIRRELGDLQVPPTVRDSVLERLDRLAPAAARVVRAAAVLVGAADDTVCEVAGVTGQIAVDALGEAVNRWLLQPDDQGRLEFRHALVRKAVYEAIPAPERRRLHRRAGEILERVAPSAAIELTRHFREAGEPDGWCRYAEQAAELAIATNDYRTAATLLTELLPNAELSPPDRVRLTSTLTRLTLFHRTPGVERDAVAQLRRLLTAAELTPAEEGEVRSRLGGLLARLREFDAGRAELERAVPLVRDNPVETMRVLTALGWPLGRLPAREHLRWLREAAELDLHRLPPAEQLTLLANQASALLLLGEEAGWEAVAQMPTDAPSLQERLNLAIGSMNVGMYAINWGRYEEARLRLSLALQLADTDQFVWMRDCILVAQAHLDWFTGTWDGLAERVTPFAEGNDTDPEVRLEAAEVAALLRARDGISSRIAAQLHWVVEESRRLDVFDRPLVSGCWLARSRLEAGDVAEALALTDEAVRTAGTTGVWIAAAEAVRVRVPALVATGRANEAARLVSAFARGLRGRTAPAPRTALAECRAVLAEAAGAPESAARGWARAAAAWERMPRPYDALLAQEGEGRCLIAAGRVDAGMELLTTAFHELTRIGARHDAERVAERLRSQGVEVRRQWRRGRQGYGNELSPRELEVVRLVVTGRTNREIAETISRSPKTVAWQVNSAMRKLGASTRTALAVAAIEAGVVNEQ